MTRPRLAAACAALVAAFLTFATAAQDSKFIGVITQNKVEVRSGAGRAYYVVGELAKGDMVRVEKVLFNQTWYQVRVPKGINSYVSKAFVDAQGDGETGTINTDRTEFKAASLRGPGESYRVQGTLSKGDKVTILAEEGNFYKITSPNDSYVFIPAGTVRKATAEDLQGAGEEPKPEPKPEPVTPEPKPEPVTPVPPVEPKPEPVTPEPKPEPVTPEPKPEPKPEPVTPEPKPEPVTPEPKPEPVEGWPTPPNVKVETPARSEALKSLELKVLPYFSLPVTEQPLSQMAKAYQDLQDSEGLPGLDKQIITVRLRLIERRQQILATIERAKAAQNKSLAKTVVPDEPEEEARPKQYTAVGLLQPSTVYDGKSLPLLYRLVDATPSNRTLAYVAPSDELNVAAMLNQIVGVVGQTNYNRALRLNVIEIDKAVLLEPDTESSDEPAEESAEAAAEETAE